MSSHENEPPETVRFRPSKKRKNYRQRTSASPEPSPAQGAPAQRATAADYFDDTKRPPSPERTVIRATRHTRRPRPTNVNHVDDDERGLVLREEQHKPVEDRFVKSTSGRTIVDDRHMNAFIESRLSSRSAALPLETDEAFPGPMDEDTPDAVEKKTSTSYKNQIQEVDLPPLPRLDDEQKVERPRKVRLGPDGKPWRGGRRKRRGSDDIARDKMVEELLHENRLDVYDHPAKAADDGADGDADERIATQFQKQYLEDVARKQQKQKAAQQKQKEEGEVLKGPKLGGSRNDRAAVREALLKTQREGQR